MTDRRTALLLWCDIADEADVVKRRYTHASGVSVVTSASGAATVEVSIESTAEGAAGALLAALAALEEIEGEL